ncbi:MAG: hypothetical protein WDM80_17695 [Limisphaerales bacterium]
MKQRVSLGRALVYDPDVLILDEPAAGLIPRARVELRELLMLLAERKKAILISSHILTELTEICNGVVIIERGKILETGTIEEVLKKSATRRTVAVRLLDTHHHENPQLLRELLQLPHIENARQVAGEIHFELSLATSPPRATSWANWSPRNSGSSIPADQGQPRGYFYERHQGRRAMNFFEGKHSTSNI